MLFSEKMLSIPLFLFYRSRLEVICYSTGVITDDLSRMGDVDEGQIKEVIGFLKKSCPPHVRSLAVEFFLGITGSEDGRSFLLTHQQLLPPIVNMLDDEVSLIVRDTLLSLVNMSTSPSLADCLLKLESHPTLDKDLLMYVLHPEKEYADKACMILSNLTRSEHIAEHFVNLMVANSETVGFDKVVEAFCKKDFNKNANLHYLGTFLWNLTQIKSARKYILDKERLVIQKLLPYTQFYESEIRRGSAVGILYNCCFETEYHEWLLSEEVDILPRLLLPLAGPEEFDEDDMEKLPEDLQYLEPSKTREPDPDIRRMLADAIYQLCATKPCRMFIKEKNTYIIMRELDNWETDRTAKASIQQLILLLIGDEPEPGMENLREVEIPKDVEKTLKDAYEKEQAEIAEESKTLQDSTANDKA